MVNWYSLLWMSLLCLMAACGPNNPPASQDSEANSPEPPTPALPESPDSTTDDEPSALSSPTSKSESPSVSARALADTTIIPAEQVGPITPTTDRAELADLFGEAALTDTEVHVGEGFTESGTAVNADTDQALSVIWMDDSQSQPSVVRELGRVWQTPEGIRVGTSFADLQAILGEFQLYGFGWDYGGTVVLEGSNLDEYYGALILRLQPTDPGVFQTMSEEALSEVQGDRQLSSDNPYLPELDLVVGEMIVYLNPPVQ